MAPIDLPHTLVGDQLSGRLLVLAREQRGVESQAFVILTLGNASGRIRSAPFWPEAVPQLAGIGQGSVVEVSGEVVLYRECRQLRVTTIHPVPAENVEWDALLPSVGDTTSYWRSLDGWRAQIAGPRLRTILALFYQDEDFRRRYDRCPASVAGHHARLGGLLRHTWEVASIARSMCRTAPADPDLVLAGALLHDIGKLEAYRWEHGFAMSERGHLYGHVVLGSLMLQERIHATPDDQWPQEELDLLQHLILSHHGNLEFGAPVQPMTLEAELLHYADDASAKLDTMAQAICAPDLFHEDRLISAQPVWQLNRRRVFRGKSQWGL